MSKSAKSLSIDDVRAQFAKATEVFWVCPITKKSIPAHDLVAIAAHQAEIIVDMEQKEKARLRANLLRSFESQRQQVTSLDHLRSLSLARIRLDYPDFLESAMPAMSVHFPKHQVLKMFSNEFVLLSGPGLTPEVRRVLDAKQGEHINQYVIGKNMKKSWFLLVPSTSGLGVTMAKYTRNKSPKMSAAQKQDLLANDEAYCVSIHELKALGAQIHALRAQVSALTKHCDGIRQNALTILPPELM